MKIPGLILIATLSLLAPDLALSDPSQLGKSFETEAPQSEPQIPAEIENYEFDGLSGLKIKQALSAQYGERGSLSVRGRHDAEIYRLSSPSVVIVLTKDGLGSGVYVGTDRIVTNWHVVQS
jgi:hypothetical protein